MSEIEDTQLCSHYFLNLKLHEWWYEDMLLKMIINTHNVTHIHIQLCLGRWKKIVITTECSWVTMSNILMDVMAGMNPLQDGLQLNLFQSQRRRHRWKAADKYIRIFFSSEINQIWCVQKGFQLSQSHRRLFRFDCGFTVHWNYFIVTNIFKNKYFTIYRYILTWKIFTFYSSKSHYLNFPKCK